MDVLAKPKVVTVQHYISVSNQHLLHFKLIKFTCQLKLCKGGKICIISFCLHECLSLEILDNNSYRVSSELYSFKKLGLQRSVYLCYFPTPHELFNHLGNALVCKSKYILVYFQGERKGIFSIFLQTLKRHLSKRSLGKVSFSFKMRLLTCPGNPVGFPMKNHAGPKPIFFALRVVTG